MDIPGEPLIYTPGVERRDETTAETITRHLEHIDEHLDRVDDHLAAVWRLLASLAPAKPHRPGKPAGPPLRTRDGDRG